MAPLAAEFARNGLSEKLSACDRESFPSGKWSEPAGFAVRSTLSPLSHEPMNEDGGSINAQSRRIHHHRRSAAPHSRDSRYQDKGDHALDYPASPLFCPHRSASTAGMAPRGISPHSPS